jgi:hypothetical protein
MRHELDEILDIDNNLPAEKVRYLDRCPSCPPDLSMITFRRETTTKLIVRHIYEAPFPR